MRALVTMTVIAIVVVACRSKPDRRGADQPGDALVTGSAPASATPAMTGSASCDATKRTHLDGLVQLAGGDRHVCARKADGTVACWGDNAAALLGVGTTADIDGPVQVCGLTDVVEVAATTYHTCARRTDGSVWCWGANTSGELGDGTTSPRATPVRVVGVRRAIGVAVAGFDSCALEADGTVVCWGLGGGKTPRAVPGVANAEQIAIGSGTKCALIRGGTVVCWSDETDGRTGSVTRAPTRPAPVLGLEHVRAIAHHWYLGCATMIDGTVRCWDKPEHGAGPVATLTGVDMVAAGLRHACAVKTDGTVACWGSNGNGQLGDQGPDSGLVPRSVVGLAGVASVTAGQGFTCALLRTGAVTCWGAEPQGTVDQARAAAAARRQAWEAGPKLCPIDRFVLYQPGCAPAGVHTCVSAIPPCAEQYCSCEGTTVIGCGGATTRIRHAGPCK